MSDCSPVPTAARTESAASWLHCTVNVAARDVTAGWMPSATVQRNCSPSMSMAGVRTVRREVVVPEKDVPSARSVQVAPPSVERCHW
ncbi:MAG: hypothetical protein BWX86_02231 [Verrucomicrobia bacterium ADurb.Bin122]|nr:MAG: hypothetical protein BWX86_02231 [Verrucomicrobia bacterium ADurb.Bin122]